MRKAKLLWRILRTVDGHLILGGFLTFTIVLAFVFQIIEPNIDTLGDAIWYCFAIISSCGFGDVVAVTSLGRILSMVLGFYSILIISLVPGVVISYYVEFSKVKATQSYSLLADKLENLPNLSKEELAEISQTIKERRYKI